MMVYCRRNATLQKVAPQNGAYLISLGQWQILEQGIMIIGIVATKQCPGVTSGSPPQNVAHFIFHVLEIRFMVQFKPTLNFFITKFLFLYYKVSTYLETFLNTWGWAAICRQAIIFGARKQKVKHYLPLHSHRRT